MSPGELVSVSNWGHCSYLNDCRNVISAANFCLLASVSIISVVESIGQDDGSVSLLPNGEISAED